MASMKDHNRMAAIEESARQLAARLDEALARIEALEAAAKAEPRKAPKAA